MPNQNRLVKGRLRSRNSLGWWLNSLGLIGSGVEVGVQTGLYAETLLDTWKGERLFLVDAWRHLPEYRDSCNVSDQLMAKRFVLAKQRLARFGPRPVFLRMLSRDAAKRIPNASLDFAYIDANHAYRAVLRDLSLWYPKVKSGGVIAGHDYYDAVPDQDLEPIISSGLPKRLLTSYGVRTAVDEFAFCHGLRIGCTQEKWPTWYAIVR